MHELKYMVLICKDSPHWPYKVGYIDLFALVLK